ncbi:MAG TPA: RidA family protein [Candidatus Lustribacter sp.]|nr:RidA family protein [Candidatus Lustribacter sp.]
MSRRSVESGGPWEQRYGYSRAVRSGGLVAVSGCTSVVDGTVAHPDDAGAQAEVALQTATSAVEALGGTLEDIIRTRMYVVHRGDFGAVGEAHARWFGQVRPAATMVLVAGLVDPAMRVEIEVDAVLPATGAAGDRERLS